MVNTLPVKTSVYTLHAGVIKCGFTTTADQGLSQSEKTQTGILEGIKEM